MRTLDTAVLAHLQQRGTQHAQLLAWVQARNRETDAIETIGFWTGADHEDFVVNGQTRTYYGAGTMLKVNPLIGEAGLKVRTSRLKLSHLAPEVQIAIRGYDARNAPCELHVAYFDPVSHALIDSPQRVFKGVIAGVDITRGEIGNEGSCEVGLLSSARSMIRTLALKKSDTALRARAPGDAFRQYTDISGTVEAVWGEQRAAAPSAPAAAAAPSPSRESPGK